MNLEEINNREKVSLGKKVLRVVSWLVIGGVVALILYVTVIERWQLKWGSSASEQTMVIPGDEMVPNPQSVSTRALTINAPVDKVWPWLAQMGQGKGGMYSYDFLENIFGCDIHSSDKIVPEWLDIKAGDTVQLDGKRRAPGMPVVAVDQGKTLTLGGSHWLWTFYLMKVDEKTTRMVVRNRSSWPNWKEGVPTRYILQPISFVMERKMLLGIKARAEAL